mgnify:CR=1 FL=1
MAGLVDVVQRLSLARDLPTVQEIVRRAARSLTGADGATFVLRDGDLCHYADEDAIAPLWKGRRFPMEVCISGWCMLNRQATIIEDIYADPRIPHEAYRPTFVKSLVMTPIRTMDPLGAIGAYWATPHRATPAEVQLLQALADTTAVAVEHVRVITELEERVRARTAELELRNQELSATNNELLAAQQQADRVFAAYAKGLADFIQRQPGSEGLVVWTSTLKRAPCSMGKSRISAMNCQAAQRQQDDNARTGRTVSNNPKISSCESKANAAHCR